MSNLYPEIHEALREAGLLKEKTKLPKFGTVLDPQRKGYKTAAEKKIKEEKVSKNYIHTSMRSSQTVGKRFLCMQLQTIYVAVLN